MRVVLHGSSIHIARRKVKWIRQLARFLLAAVVLSGGVARGAFEAIPAGPRAAGMGGAGVALGGDIWGSVRNPALIIGSQSGAGVFWSQQYELPEFSREGVVARSTVGKLPLAMRAENFGTDLYREGTLGVTSGWRVGQAVDLGLAIEGGWLSLAGLPESRVLVFSAGMAAHPIAGLDLAAVWRNLNEPRLPGYRDRILSSLTLGLAVEVGAQGRLAADVLQEQGFPAEYRVGAEVDVLPSLHLRAGLRAEPMRPSAGFQVDVGRWSFFYGGDLHPDLGPSHEVGLQFRARP